MKNVLFVGGGSVGHIAPSIAVWRELEALGDYKAHFVCSPRPDDALFLDAQHVQYTVFNAPRLSLLVLLKFMKAFDAAKKILDQHKPDVVFSKGGYVSVPVCIAAHLRGIPIVLHETDTVSGRANGVVSRFATKVCTGFPPKEPSEKEVYTGNPVRSAVLGGSKEKGLEITGLSGQKPIVLVWGGSQGALVINQAIAAVLDDLLEHCDIVHITGQSKSTVKQTKEGYWFAEFITDDIPHIHALADVSISRAGGGSISELAAYGTPTILVPLRGVGHDHQQNNAQTIAQNNACIVLQDSSLQDTLVPTVQGILANEERRTLLSKNIRAYYSPNSAKQIAEILVGALA